jgi:hypothetical protein
MENIKEKYYQRLILDNGKHDEIELGESIHIDEETTRKVIGLLLSEYKIEFKPNKLCNYSILK